jgi:hypothetical protein
VRDFIEKVCNCLRDFTDCREGFDNIAEWDFTD